MQLKFIGISVRKKKKKDSALIVHVVTEAAFVEKYKVVQKNLYILVTGQRENISFVFLMTQAQS